MPRSIPADYLFRDFPSRSIWRLAPITPLARGECLSYTGLMFSLLAFLALAASASAADLDFDSPGFWTKRYDIPMTYCRNELVLESPDIESAIRRVPKCNFDPAAANSDSAFSYCRTTDNEFDGLLNELFSIGKLAFYRRECTGIPSYPELTYKRDKLKNESNDIHLPSQTLPGISGLVEAELQMLGILLDAQTRASKPVLAILFLHSAPGRSEEIESMMKARIDSTPERNREEQVRFDGFNPWRRGPYPACDQVPTIRARYIAPTGSDKEREIEKQIRSLGEPFDDPDCFRFRGGNLAVLSRLPLEQIGRKMADLDGLEYWSKVGQLRHAAAVLDDKRDEILSKELVSGASLLERAPHIRSLAKAEIELVRPAGEKIQRARTGTLIVVTIKHE